MRILVACEYSGRVREAFRKLGHDAYSCDILPADDGSPYHYQCDVAEVIGLGWDMMIAHPPCTYLTIAAEWAYNDVQTKNIKPGTLIGEARRQARNEALAFFKMLYDAPIKRICVENPVGVVPSRLGIPSTQTIQPHMFGEDASKATCLWLKGLPKLRATQNVPPPYYCNRRETLGKPNRQRAKPFAANRRPLENPKHNIPRNCGRYGSAMV